MQSALTDFFRLFAPSFKRYARKSGAPGRPVSAAKWNKPGAAEQRTLHDLKWSRSRWPGGIEGRSAFNMSAAITCASLTARTVQFVRQRSGMHTRYG